MVRASIKIFALAGILLASITFLSPAIDNYRYSFLLKKGVFERDILYNILGEARKILSLCCYVNAEVYHHGGIYNVDRGECAQLEAEEQVEHILKLSGGHDEGAHHDHDHHGHKEVEETKISKRNVLLYIGEAVHVGRHMHLHGEEVKEIVPWYQYAVQLDPNNINAYSVGGWTVWRTLDRQEEGLKFLKRGLIHNPDSWSIYKDLGHFYLVGKKDYQEALVYLIKAYELISDDNSNKYDRRMVYTFMAYCYEMTGENDRAIGLYREVLALFPDDEALINKIASLSGAPLGLP